MHAPTPSQTIGPFFRPGMDWLTRTDLVDPADPTSVAILGRVLDADGATVVDAVVEIWQADGDGCFDRSDRGMPRGFGRCLTDGDGCFRFVTTKPVVKPPHAPHIDVSVFARGLLQRVVTRIYFPDDAPQHDRDPVLSSLASERRSTLIASLDGDSLRFDIHLSGDAETVFFDW